MMDMTPEDRRIILISKLTAELFRYDQGFVFDLNTSDPDELLEYSLKQAWVTNTLLPIIQPFLNTGRIVHGDDLSD